VPEADHLRAAALTAMNQALADWVLERFHEVARADFLADQAVQALSGDLTTDDLPRRLQETIRSQPFQAWRTLWSELATKRCQEILAGRQEQISRLIRAHRQELASTSPTREEEVDNEP